MLRSAALAVAAVAFTLLALEILMRAIPGLLPTGSYGHGSWDPELQMNTHGGSFLYHQDRTLWRHPNRHGFMDVDHDPEKPPGILRVGAFGDSYVEAVQVQLEETFFRRLPERIGGGTRIEALGFGMSGWGTLHSLLNARVQAPRYDLDFVIYLFVENDPADSSYRVQKELGLVAAPKPYADFEAGGAGFEIRWLSEPGSPSLARRLAKLLQSRSLLAQLMWNRVYHLLNQGIRLRRDPDAAEMAARADGRPDPNALPSTWPPATREHVAELNRRILASFSEEMRRAGRHFAVLYVPRGEAQLRGEIALADTWRPWLGGVCAELSIPLIDPSDALRARMARGDAVYGDHWTPAGHDVIAQQLAIYLKDHAESTRKRSDS